MRITGGLRIVGGMTFTDGVNANLPVLRWDPTYITGGIPVMLTNGNSRVVDMDSGSFTVIGTNKIPSTGTYMFTVRMNYNYDALVPDIGGYVGVGSRNFSITTNLGGDGYSIGYSDTGDLFYDGSTLDTGYPSFNVNATKVIDIVIHDYSTMWIRVNGGDWNGNPSSDLLTGGGGTDITGGSFTDLYPMVTVAGDMGPTEFELLKTSPYGVPSGVTFFNMYTPATTPFVPLGTPSSIYGTDALFEMGQWSSGDATQVPDLSGYNRAMSLNDNAAGTTDWYHFFNNSAQANNSDWPTTGVTQLTIMGWFAFGNLTSTTSLISRTEGGDGWALRVDSNGADINLVKYNIADQIVTLNAPLSLNDWHFIAVSQDGANLTFVVDGTTYTATGSSVGFATSGGPVRLQYDPYNSGNQNAEMYMREVRILEMSLSSSQLTTVYNNSKTNYGY